MTSFRKMLKCAGVRPMIFVILRAHIIDSNHKNFCIRSCKVSLGWLPDYPNYVINRSIYNDIVSKLCYILLKRRGVWQWMMGGRIITGLLISFFPTLECRFFCIFLYFSVFLLSFFCIFLYFFCILMIFFCIFSVFWNWAADRPAVS